MKWHPFFMKSRLSCLVRLKWGEEEVEEEVKEDKEEKEEREEKVREGEEVEEEEPAPPVSPTTLAEKQPWSPPPRRPRPHLPTWLRVQSLCQV